MNPASLKLALIMTALVAGTALFINWWAKRSHHWPARKRRLIVGGLLVFSVITGIYTYESDVWLRGTTLFEVAGPCEENGNRLWIFEVEHPGVEHTLMVSPHLRGITNVSRPVILRTRLGVEGKPPLINDESVYDVVVESGKDPTAMTWREKFFTFVPRSAERHQLIVETIGEAPPRLHLRIADPEKRDGQRTKGY